MRALVLFALAAPAAAEDLVRLGVEGDRVTACMPGCPCTAFEARTGKVVGPANPVPRTFEVSDDEPDPAAAVKRCGTKCGAIAKRLAGAVSAVDPTEKLLFLIEDLTGSTWSLVTGRRIAEFPLNQFDEPPPPTSLDHATFVGRHVLVGEPGYRFTLTYDIYSGAQRVLVEHVLVGHGLALENDGMGRFDLIDLAQAGSPRVAVRRILSPRLDPVSVYMYTIAVADRTVVVVPDPPLSLLVDPRKRTISKPRRLPACSPAE